MSDIICPFCGEIDFDLEGLKMHLFYGWCDAYNILDKYYDIAGKTGFQGQVRAGFEGATGILDVIGKTAEGLIGETPAVRQKALERILDEVLGN